MSEIEAKTAVPGQRSLEELRKLYLGKIGQALISPRNRRSPLPAAMMQLGRQYRETYTQYPILNGAVNAYVDLAATREWAISGKPRAAAQATDWLNNTETINPYTGMVDYGYEQFLRRRVPDYLFVGATTMVCLDEDNSPLEYADPTHFTFMRKIPENPIVNKVEPEEVVWLYAKMRELKAKEVWTHYPRPQGADGFIAPAYSILPTATLAWLIRESDTMAVDGRKIRDVLLLASPQIQDSIEEALLTQIALWDENVNPLDTGVPVISLNGVTMPIKDLFAWLGVSQLPDTFSREEFTFYYVNEIAANLGIALRQFWNNERTTNRALEVVQEQRQQQKGPSAFVRSEQRLLNRSGLLKRFGGSSLLPTRMAFIEETDASTMKDRAEVLKATAEAFGLVMDRFGATISIPSYVAWLQSERILPEEIELMEGVELPGAISESDPDRNGNPEAGTESSDPKPTSAQQSSGNGAKPAAKPAAAAAGAPKSYTSLEEELEDGEVLVKSDGTVIARRSRVYSLNMLLAKSLAQEKEASEVLAKSDPQDFIEMLQENHRLQVLEQLMYDDKNLDKWVTDPHYEGMAYKILNGASLSDDETALMLQIAVEV